MRSSTALQRPAAAACVALAFLVFLYLSTSRPAPVPFIVHGDDEHTPATTRTATAPTELQPKFKIVRTSRLPYNFILPGERYLIYSPSGGFNNQREELESAVQIALMTNRTLLAPMAGKHTSFWLKYATLRPERNELVPMDHIVDFDYLEGFGAKIVALNDTVFRTVQDFSKRMGQGSVVMFSPVDMDGDGVLRLRRSKAPLLYLHGKGMYHNFFAISTMVKVRRRTRYAAHMRHMALRVVKDAFPDGFYAFHIRMGDSASRFEKDGTVFVALAIAQRWKLKKLPVYVATEPTRDAKFFAPIERSMKAVFSDNLNEDLIAEFKNEWPKGTIRVDMLGILEQLLCAQAKRFIGTRTSTFSAYITFMRKFQGEAFPEMLQLEESEGDEVSVDLGLKEESDDSRARDDDDDERAIVKNKPSTSSD